MLSKVLLITVDPWKDYNTVILSLAILTFVFIIILITAYILSYSKRNVQLNDLIFCISPTLICMYFSIFYWYIALLFSIVCVWGFYLKYKSEKKILKECNMKEIANYHTSEERNELLKKWDDKQTDEKEMILNINKDKLKNQKDIKPQYLIVVSLIAPVLYILIFILIGFNYSLFP